MVDMAFHQSPGSKVRPAVVILDSGDEDFVVALVTSQAARSEYDLAITDWSAAGLSMPSIVRTDKVTVLFKADMKRKLGKLPVPTSLL